MLVAFKHVNPDFLNSVCVPTVNRDGVRFPLRYSKYLKKVEGISGEVPTQMYRVCEKKSLKLAKG